MKLRNKKTGEIWDIGKVLVSDYPCWETLTQICEDWEDVKEPLIKDEKIRKAVRAWADANNVNSKHYYENDVRFNLLEHELTWIDTSIQFNEVEALVGLEDGKRYTIDELCGEDEE